MTITWKVTSIFTSILVCFVGTTAVFGQTASFTTPKIAATLQQRQDTSVAAPPSLSVASRPVEYTGAIQQVRYTVQADDFAMPMLPSSSSELPLLPTTTPEIPLPQPSSSSMFGSGPDTYSPPSPARNNTGTVIPSPMMTVPNDVDSGLSPQSPYAPRSILADSLDFERERQQADEKPCPPNSIKSIREISVDISPKTGGPFPRSCPLTIEDEEPRNPICTTVHWKASTLYSKGSVRYFEDVQLERYGHSISPALQPLISGGRFFLTLPILPYKMGITTPDECVYDLGYHRPGSCSPYIWNPIPISLRGALFQTGAVMGAVHLIP